MSKAYRNKCLEEKGTDCQICSSRENIVAHHINGDRSDNRLQNLIPVCRVCHGKIHVGKELGDPYDRFTSQLPERALLDGHIDYTSKPIETTHIEITENARRKLRVYKAKRDMTYTEAIHDLVPDE